MKANDTDTDQNSHNRKRPRQSIGPLRFFRPTSPRPKETVNFFSQQYTSRYRESQEERNDVFPEDFGGSNQITVPKFSYLLGKPHNPIDSRRTNYRDNSFVDLDQTASNIFSDRYEPPEKRLSDFRYRQAKCSQETGGLDEFGALPDAMDQVITDNCLGVLNLTLIFI